MPMLLLIVIIGIVAGLLAARFMRVGPEVPSTIAIGIAGAAIGWFVLRLLMAVSGWAAYLAGAVLGAVLLIWFWRIYVSRV